MKVNASVTCGACKTKFPVVFEKIPPETLKFSCPNKDCKKREQDAVLTGATLNSLVDTALADICTKVFKQLDKPT